MKYFYIEPEVAGHIGLQTVIDRNVHPPIISQLHYEIDGWLGDAILESFPAFIVTELLKQDLPELSGAQCSVAYVTTSSQFHELFENTILPKFVWLKPTGAAGKDDFGIATDGRLVVSERALGLLQKHGIANALTEPFNN